MSYANIYKFKKAEELYKRGLNIDKNNNQILNNLANLKKELDKTDEAIDIYNKILSKQPNAIAAIYNLANLYNTIEFENPKLFLIF